MADTKGIYVDVHAGISQLKAGDLKIDNVMYSPVHSVDFKSKLKKRSDEVFLGGITVGYNFKYKQGLPLRLELNYTARDSFSGDQYFQENNIDSQHISKLGLQTLMTNLWFDISTDTPVTIYVGGGVGAAYAKYQGKTHFLTSTSESQISDHKVNFAWQLGFGLNYWLYDHWSFDLGYRYLDAGKIKTSKWLPQPGINVYFSEKANIKSNEFMLAARYTF